MVYNFCMPVLISVIFMVIVSVNGRPTESNIDNDLGDKNAVQIVEQGASEEDAPVKSLPYYGGAKGKYLLIHPSGRTSITNHNPSLYGIKSEEDEEEDVGMENEENADENEQQTNSTNGSNPDESVCVGLPPDNASVAEAKPVGLAVAGPGGVASSRPVGTAVVGPSGMAISKPVATAFAGVAGAEQLIGLGGGGKKRYDRPQKTTVPANFNNKTKEDRSVFGGRNYNYPNVFQYSNSVPQGYNVFYIPLYLPKTSNISQ